MKPQSAADDVLHARLDVLCADGWAIWERFDRTVRERGFHPFVAADYEVVRATLLPLRARGRRFLEWGSATGIITIMADLMGFDACGIEVDPALVATAREVAARHGSGARFVTGSFLPAGYRWRGADGDTRTGTIEDGPSGYLALGRAPDDFDVVIGYPWGGEAPVMEDVMRRYGRRDALLLLYQPDGTVRTYRGDTSRAPRSFPGDDRRAEGVAGGRAVRRPPPSPTRPAATRSVAERSRGVDRQPSRSVHRPIVRPVGSRTTAITSPSGMAVRGTMVVAPSASAWRTLSATSGTATKSCTKGRSPGGAGQMPPGIPYRRRCRPRGSRARCPA